MEPGLGERSSFFLVGNIPPAFRSSDLRGFFSHFTERRGFTCFHYRHRPELPHASALGDETRSEATQIEPPCGLPNKTVEEVAYAESVLDVTGSAESRRSAVGLSDGGRGKEQGDLVEEEEREGSTPPPVRTCCCVVAVARGMERDFLNLHRNKHWTLPDGELLRRRVRISRLRVELDVDKDGKRLTFKYLLYYPG